MRRMLVWILLGFVGLCLVACAVAWVYQQLCSVEARPGCSWPLDEGDEMLVRPGESTQFSVNQWDCLLANLGFHGCYEPVSIDVDGLPPGSNVQRLETEWFVCHGTCFLLQTSLTTPPGTYRLAIRLKGSGKLWEEHLILVVMAP